MSMKLNLGLAADHRIADVEEKRHLGHDARAARQAHGLVFNQHGGAAGWAGHQPGARYRGGDVIAAIRAGVLAHENKSLISWVRHQAGISIRDKTRTDAARKKA